jgi:DNA helicase II / ATP-dependent DNA helicase PcrA
MPDTFAKAQQLYECGQRDEAEKLFEALVRQKPDLEAYWVWLERCTDNPQRKRECIEKILRIHPGNRKAQRRLEQLQQGSTSNSASQSSQASKSTPGTSQGGPAAAQANKVASGASFTQSSEARTSQAAGQGAEDSPIPRFNSVTADPQSRHKQKAEQAPTVAGSPASPPVVSLAPAIKVPDALRGTLDPQQYAAARHRGANLLIIAGAGSGKTRALTFRAISLLNEIPPERLMVVTFTKKAAREVQDRILGNLSEAMKRDIQSAWIGTIHSICWRMLMENGHLVGLAPNWNVLDQTDSERVMGQAARPFGYADVNAARNLCQLYSYARNSMTAWRQWVNTQRFPDLRDQNVVGKIVDSYARRCRRSNRVDFDDLQVLAVRLLEQQSDVRSAYRDRFKAILVDEYQDTNRIQARFLSLLAGTNNITVVGDDAQAIYGFRAATVDNILSFEKDFAAQRVTVSTNYRSSPEIVAFADASISNNRHQIPKVIRACRSSCGLPQFHVAQSPTEEARFICSKMQEHLRNGLRPGQVAVLFRATRQAAALEIELKRAGIAYELRGGDDFFSLEHIKVVLDVIRLLINVEDSIALGNVQSLVGFSSPVVIEALEVQADQTGSSIWELAEQQAKVAPAAERKDYQNLLDFRKTLGRLSSQGPAGQDFVQRLIGSTATVESILPTVTAILQMLMPHLKKRYAAQWEDVNADLTVLANIASQYTALADFVNSVSLQQFEEKKNQSGPEPVVLSTIHSAKGLEWETVVVLGLVEFWFPLNLAIRQTGTDEEERRLFYVAVTRARTNLLLTSYSWSVNPYGRTMAQTLSRFIQEVPRACYQSV